MYFRTKEKLSKALEYFSLPLKITKKYLQNSLPLAESFNSIGSVY